MRATPLALIINNI